MTKQLMNLSSENCEAIQQSFLTSGSWKSVSELSQIVTFLPFVIVFRPQENYNISATIAELLKPLPEADQLELRRRILKRLIHPFESPTIISGYAAIASFLSIAVRKHKLFEIYDIANAVYDLMLMNPQCNRIFVEFFFWFGQVFDDFSHKFVKKLRRYAEIENGEKRLPKRYRAVFKDIDELAANNWKKYKERALVRDPLKDAITTDNVDAFGELVQSRVDLNFRMDVGTFERCWILFDSPTVLQYCAFFGATKCIDYLLQRKVDLDLRDNKGRHFFDFAIAGCHQDIIQRFMSAAPSPEVAMKVAVMFHHNNLLVLKSEGNKEYLEECVKNAIRANNFYAFLKIVPTCGVSPKTMLLRAIVDESQSIALWIMGHVAKIDWNGLWKGKTLLHIAVQTNQVRVVAQMLKFRDVDTEALDSEGRTPLQLAASLGNVDVLETLLACDRVNVNARWPNGRSILHEVILRSALQCVPCILACERFDVNCVDEDGETALHTVVCNLNSKGTYSLVQGNPSEDRLVRDALYIKAFGRLVHDEILRLLLECPRVNINVFDNIGVSFCFIGLQFIMQRNMGERTLSR